MPVSRPLSPMQIRLIDRVWIPTDILQHTSPSGIRHWSQIRRGIGNQDAIGTELPAGGDGVILLAGVGGAVGVMTLWRRAEAGERSGRVEECGGGEVTHAWWAGAVIGVVDVRG